MHKTRKLTRRTQQTKHYLVPKLIQITIEKSILKQKTLTTVQPEGTILLVLE